MFKQATVGEKGQIEGVGKDAIQGQVRFVESLFKAAA
jgi:hypothetical protein